MKKTLSVLLAAVISAVFVASAIPGASALALDGNNTAGISKWSAIPLVSEQNIADGYSGGEGCQHLTSVSRDETDGELLFAGTDCGGTFRSTDGGDTWKPCNRGLNTRGVCRVSVDPMNKNHLVAINCMGSASKYNALYYSFDMGETWLKSSNTNLGYRAGYYSYISIAFDKTSYNELLGYCTDVYWSTPFERDSSNLLTDSTAGLYRSVDGGASYAKIESEHKLFDGILVINNGLVYLANQHGIYIQSEADGGFTQVSEKCVQSFLYVNGLFYVQTDEAIYTSQDLAEYTQINSANFPAGRNPRNLEVSPINSNYMVLAAKKSSIQYSERPYYSYDGGVTWALADISNTAGLFYHYTYSSDVFTFHPQKEGEVIATQGGVMMKSLDWGKTWKSSNDGLNNVMCGGKFNFNVYDPNLIYVGAQDFGGALTTDGGKTWKNISLSKDGDGRNIYGGYAATENTLFGVYTEQWGNSVLRTTQRYVCFSHDGGKTVNITKTMLNDDAAQFEPVRISENIRGSWESSYQSPNNKDILFCANYRSVDGGYNWSNMLGYGGDVKCLQVYTHSGKTLYGANDGGGYVVKSEDDGATWTKVNSVVLAGTDYLIADIAVDSVNGYIYAAFSNKLYRMDLDGNNIVDQTPRMAKDNMGVRRIITVTVDPVCPSVVYCGGSGDYYQNKSSTRRSCDSGETWYTVTCSTASDCIVNDGSSLGFEPKCLRVNPLTGELWCGTSCLGFSKLSPPYMTCALTPDAHDLVADAPIEASCVSTGLTAGTHCSICKQVITPQQIIPKLEHTDLNGDEKCDECGCSMPKEQQSCSHMCHSTGFMGFIWKIVNFFNKLFKTNQYCSCGERHW